MGAAAAPRRWRAMFVIGAVAFAVAGGCGDGGHGKRGDGTETPTLTPTPTVQQPEAATPSPPPQTPPATKTSTQASPAAASATPTPTSTPLADDDGLCFIGAPRADPCTGSAFPASQSACCEAGRLILAPREVNGWCPDGAIDDSTIGCKDCRAPCEGLPTPTAGATPSPEACGADAPCPTGRFCELPAGVCASGPDEGTCVDVPPICIGTVEPVCGCDGLTYGNDCQRRAARVQKAHDGPCPVTECGDGCDCYATRTFTSECPLECLNCGSFWTCEDGHCIEHCGFIPTDVCEAFCFANEACAADAYCQKPQGRCDGLGACRPRPEQCPDVVDPVCGCDGSTYSNDCEAAMAGIAVAHRGACEEPPTPSPTATPAASPSPEPCDVTDPCTPGRFCELPAGVCASDLDAGTCVDVPPFCFDLGAPVCGCDGLTYGSDCLRRAARVQKSQDGPCPTVECADACDCYATRKFAAACPLLCPACGNFWTCEEGSCIEQCGPMSPGGCEALCTGNDVCPPDAFCRKPVGECDGLGACRPRPDFCPNVVDPVCGCNGETYSNECDAAAAGVAVAHRGECRPLCDTILGIPCPAGQFCEHPPGMCNVADLGGECVEPGDTCPLVIDPVCGCDGVTYDNDCERQRARVSLDHTGPCAHAQRTG